MRVKSSEIVPGLAIAWSPGSVKFANAPPLGMKRWQNVPRELGAAGIDDA